MKKKKLWEKENESSKLVTLNFKENTLKKLDIMSHAIYEQSKNKYSRAQLIDVIITEYYEGFEEDFQKDFGINPVRLYEKRDTNAEEEKIEEDFDLATFPAHEEGFNEVFLGENMWRYVRINKNKIDKIKYVASYVGAPVSAITHYSVVKEIRLTNNKDQKGKYEIIFDGEAIPLSKPVPLGNTNANAMRSPRYTKLETLLKAETIDDLF